MLLFLDCSATFVCSPNVIEQTIKKERKKPTQVEEHKEKEKSPKSEGCGKISLSD